MLPDDFIIQMQSLLQDEFHSFIKSLETRPPVSIRINPKKNTKVDSTIKISWADFGYYLGERPEFVFDPHWHAGAYYVQEASSMFLEEVIKQTDIKSVGINVLDLCAAPGGKSTHLLSLINDKSLLVSNEIIGSRNSILRENLIKWGYPNVVVTLFL
jgi:16S rRNA C967 or C1407 C5-methylase (RsmB/RsmF family)